MQPLIDNARRFGQRPEESAVREHRTGPDASEAL